ncbi:MAG: metal-dependent transcriptional regulator [Firmicutes bacterium]|nr:metal-dependent transcriptional regulator [Candidatus Fermentithermobacillaceae bacterium]HON86670.1 metal-dependent transcriptional regulator [Bacillota bacterium]HOV66634.1 metal-dependent transcriptional regulator [Bacillota bacterium]HRC54023.1 metal-dependent transcriptional regulator [Bacillota bacterium]
MDFELSSSIEDYLEAILALSEIDPQDQSVRVTDIAERLQIAKPSVTAALNVLKEKGLVTQERYGKVFLTPEGRKRALVVQRRHRVLRKFLVDVLGVGEKVAENDACLMEHAVSPETMEKLIEFLENTVPEKEEI